MRYVLFSLTICLSSLGWGSSLPDNIESVLKEIETNQPNMPLDGSNLTTELILKYIENIHKQENRQIIGSTILLPLTELFFNCALCMPQPQEAIEKVNEFLKLLPPLVAANNNALALQIMAIAHPKILKLINKRDSEVE